jgi:hypothetical protein
MSVTPKLTSKFSIIPLEIPGGFSVRISKMSLNVANIAKQFLRKDWGRRTKLKETSILSNFKI